MGCADSRIIHPLLTRCAFGLLPLALGGCQAVGEAFLVQTGAGLIEVAGYQGAYPAHYSKSAYAIVSNEPSQRAGLTPFLLVDGHPQDEAGFAYYRFNRIYVSPGHHRLMCKVAFPGARAGSETYCLMDIDVAARRSYRLGVGQRGNAHLLQLWDQPHGGGQPTLQNEASSPPEETDFLRAVRSFDAAPGSAIVLGDAPRRFKAAQEKEVYFGPVVSAEPSYPWEMIRMRFFPAGKQSIVVNLEGTGLFPGLGARTMPPMEVELKARHVYRITARWQDGRNLVQFWDETDGAEKRPLVKEFRFGGWGT